MCPFQGEGAAPKVHLPLITGTKTCFKEDKAFSCQSGRRLRVNPAGPPPSQLMLTELVGRGAASKPGARHNLVVPGGGLGRGTDSQVGRQAEASPGPTGLRGRLGAKPGKGAEVRGPVLLANDFQNGRNVLFFKRASRESIHSSG